MKAAERELIVNENRVFDLQPGETKSLSAHVHADTPRFRVLNTRGALMRAESRQISNRTLLALAALALVLLLDRHLPWAAIASYFGL